MDLFNSKGHLTNEALDALLRGEELPTLQRLEVSEHLAYCDDCLSRYTARLSEDVLVSPATSCQASLWRRIRLRALRIVTIRYATAAAGVALMVAVLWGSAGLSGPAFLKPSQQPPAAQQSHSWTEQWSQSLGNAFSQLSEIFENLDGGARAPRGGTHS